MDERIKTLAHNLVNFSMEVKEGTRYTYIISESQQRSLADRLSRKYIR